MKKLLIGLLFSLELFAGALVLQSGSVAAHAEMMMDSEIDPLNSNLLADISMQGSKIETLSGQFWVDMNLFKSDKEDRDEHMYEALNSVSFKLATFSILSVSKTSEADMYNVHGKLSFHGVERDLRTKAKITLQGKKLTFHTKSMINMPDFGVEMPCMMFMCVQDRVDFVVQAIFSK